MNKSQKNDAALLKSSTLPEGWHKVRFGDVAKKIRETVDRKNCNLDRFVAGEHMQTDDFRINNWGTIDYGYLGPAFDHKFIKGQILYGSRRTYLRKVSIPHFDGVCANTTFVIEPTGDDLVPDLVPFVMQSAGFNDHSIRMSKGSTNPYVNWKDIACYEFAVPEKEQQRRIATILWSAEDCIVFGERFVEAAKQAKLLLMRELFDYKKGTLDTNPPELLKKSTKSIEIVNLGNKAYFKLITGGTPFTKKSEYWNGDIPWLLSGEVNNGRIYKTEKKITELGFQNSNATIVPIHSVLIALAGQGKTRGSVAINEIELTTNQSVAAIVPNNEKIDPFYIYYILESLYEEIRSYSGKEDRGGLSLSSLRKINLPIPMLSDQKKIAGILTRCDETIATARANVRATKALKMKMINEFLNA